jgi:hypothetical protein
LQIHYIIRQRTQIFYFFLMRHVFLLRTSHFGEDSLSVWISKASVLLGVWWQLKRAAIWLISNLSRCKYHRFLLTQIFLTDCIVHALLHCHFYCIVREILFVDIQKQMQPYLYKIRGTLYKLTALDTSICIKNTMTLEIT